jgi:4-amino-4-deoxy-L-arabinose transferase-like glycosyltransferase
VSKGPHPLPPSAEVELPTSGENELSRPSSAGELQFTGEGLGMKLQRQKLLRLVEISLLVLIVGLAAYLRLAQLAENPAWYSDEGTEVDIAAHWLNGEMQYLAIDQSTLIAARLPLFPLLLSGVFRIVGVSIYALRLFTALLGIISVMMLYAYVRVSHADRALALLAALLLAIYPEAVVYARLGFMYNLLTPLALLSAIGLWRYLDRGKRSGLALAASAIGLGTIAALPMLIFVLPLIIIVSVRRWRDLMWSLLLIALPVMLYAVFMLGAAPQAFLFDLNFTLARLSMIPLTQQPIAIATNLATLLARGPWLIAALAGWFVLRPGRWQWFNLLFFVLPLIALGRTSWLLGGQGFYYLIPLLPWVALGAATLLRVGTPAIWHSIESGSRTLLERWSPRRAIGLKIQTRAAQAIAALVVITIVAAPLVLATGFLSVQVQSRLPTVMDELLIDPAAARAAAKFINSETTQDDLVIVSPGWAWLLHAHAADFQQAVAATGHATPHFPGDIPPDRFAFDPRVAQAKFVAIDNVWRNWAASRIPEVADMMRQIELWPLAWQAGDIAVYRNPSH